MFVSRIDSPSLWDYKEWTIARISQRVFYLIGPGGREYGAFSSFMDAVDAVKDVESR